MRRSRYLFAFALAAALYGKSQAAAVESYRLMEWPAAAVKPQFNLIDGDHGRRSVMDFRGGIVVVFFGFTHCPDICPGELFKLARVMTRLGPLSSRVHVLFISLDPERDTPQLVKHYAATFDPRFIGLTGSSADINRAAASFSIQFAKVPLGKDYTISHSTGTYVLDEHGRLRLVGTPRSSVDDWVHDLTLLAAADSALPIE